MTASTQLRLPVRKYPFAVGDVVVRRSMANYTQYAPKLVVSQIEVDTDEMVVDGGVGGSRWIPMSDYVRYNESTPEPPALRTPQAGDRVKIRATGEIGVVVDVWIDDNEYYHAVSAVYGTWSKVFTGTELASLI